MRIKIRPRNDGDEKSKSLQQTVPTTKKMEAESTGYKSSVTDPELQKRREAETSARNPGMGFEREQRRIRIRKQNGLSGKQSGW